MTQQTQNIKQQLEESNRYAHSQEYLGDNNIKQQIENIIKNLPKYKNGSKAIPKDDIVVQYSAVSLIADEVLKVVVEKIDEIKIKDGFSEISGSYNSALDNLLSNLSPNKENKNNG